MFNDPQVYDGVFSYLENYRVQFASEKSTNETNLWITSFLKTLKKYKAIKKNEINKLLKEFFQQNTKGYQEGSYLHKSLLGGTREHQTPNDFYKSIKFEDLAVTVERDLKNFLEGFLINPLGVEDKLLNTFGKIISYLLIKQIKEITSHKYFKEFKSSDELKVSLHQVEKLSNLFNYCVSYREICRKIYSLEERQKELLEGFDNFEENIVRLIETHFHTLGETNQERIAKIIEEDPEEDEGYDKFWNYGEKKRWEDKWSKFVIESGSDHAAAKLVIKKLKKEFPDEEKYPSPTTIKDHFSPNRKSRR